MFRRRGPSEATHRAFIEAAYQGILGRSADPDGTAYWLPQLKEMTVDWTECLRIIHNSDESRMREALRAFMKTLHMTRMALFIHYVPQGRHVLDLGGAATGSPEGALFTFGYSWTPETLTIVDLPPEARWTGQDSAERVYELTARRGTKIRYVHRSMADLDFAADSSFDLVISGESIEHISEADADIVVREAYRVLQPGGYFCLDTPNARAARVQSPNALLHPEHQKEYLLSEIRDKLLGAGFVIEQELGLCPMAESVQQNRLCMEDLLRDPVIDHDPENAYVFYIQARKPA